MNRSIAIAAALIALAACGKKEEERLEIQTVPIARRSIVVDATASGTVEPINVVEVKSKSSGQIVKMPVETGSQVRPGDLLVQLDTRDVQNQYDQAAADLNAAEAKLAVSEAQKKRSDDLFRQRIITAQENETVQIDYANSNAAVIRARTSLDIAKQRLEDATVRAPVEGMVIEKTVALGQVITSATSAFGGGTTILKMADLTKVRMRALFNETDIGSVQPGQQATVTVDAYPDRPFRGTVEKIEPQAVVQQSVTMFPVLVTMSNEEGLLKPGMNGEASVLVDRRDDVLSVPNDAVRTAREAPVLATSLGLDPDSVAASVQAQMARAMGGTAARAPAEGGAPSAGSARRAMPGDVDLVALQQRPQSARAAAQPAAAQPPSGSPGAVAPQRRGEFPARTRSRPGVVFVARKTTPPSFEARVVRLGLGNFDYTEVLSGVTDGEQVALLGAAAIQASRDSSNARFRQMTGGGMPGMQRQQGGTQGGAAGGAAGARPRQ